MIFKSSNVPEDTDKIIPEKYNTELEAFMKATKYAEENLQELKLTLKTYLIKKNKYTY